MSKAFSKKLYNSKAWKECRVAYIASVFGLCERCQEVGYILHHKTWLTINNINDPDITLNHNNLYYTCKACHEIQHRGECEVIREGLCFDDDGNVMQC